MGNRFINKLDLVNIKKSLKTQKKLHNEKIVKSTILRSLMIFNSKRRNWFYVSFAVSFVFLEKLIKLSLTIKCSNLKLDQHCRHCTHGATWTRTIWLVPLG